VERRKNEEPTKVVLVSVLFMASMLGVALGAVVCGGCKTMGRGLPVPGTVSGQGEELKSINGKLYDYLQILLWVGMNNYDDRDNWEDDQPEDWDPRNGDLWNGKSEVRNRKSGNHKPEMGSRRSGNHGPGNGDLWNGKPEERNCKFGNHSSGNDRSRNGKPANGKSGMRNGKLVNGNSGNGEFGNGNSGSGRPRNKEMGKLALGGCLEIVGLPDGNERILADNMDGKGVTRLVKDAKVLKARKEKLVGRIGKDTVLLEKRCARYESSHRTLRTLQVFGGLACLFAVAVGMIIFRPR
jgi:hypothetical protein